MGNIPRHVRPSGDYFQNLKDGSQLGTTPKSLIALHCNILQNIKEVAQTMQKVMDIYLL